MHEDDAALVARAKTGNQDAFAALVERHQGRVYNLALRLAGSPEDAADLAQEAFLKAWRGLPAFQGDSSFSTWLYRLTNNTCIDFLRAEARRKGAAPSLSLDDEENGLANLTPDLAPSPQERLEERELQEALEKGLRQLSPDHRQALALRQAGLSYAEIAQATGVEEGTVKSRIARARLSLRNFLRWNGNFSVSASSELSEHKEKG